MVREKGYDSIPVPIRAPGPRDEEDGLTFTGFNIVNITVLDHDKPILAVFGFRIHFVFFILHDVATARIQENPGRKQKNESESVKSRSHAWITIHPGGEDGDGK